MEQAVFNPYTIWKLHLDKGDLEYEFVADCLRWRCVTWISFANATYGVFPFWSICSCGRIDNCRSSFFFSHIEYIGYSLHLRRFTSNISPTSFSWKWIPVHGQIAWYWRALTVLYVVCECIFRTSVITGQIQRIICRNNIAKARESGNFRFATFGGKRVWNVYITKACGTQRPFSVKCLGRCRMSITHFCHINIKRGSKFVASFLKIIKIKSAERRLQ